MIFQRSLLREVGNYAAAVFSVLFAIVVTSQLVRLLARAAGGKIPSDAILALIGFTAVNYLPILLALTLFVSVLMTVSRSYRDSEMVVWSASGLSLTAWVKPVLIFAAPVVLLITLLALFLTPWSNERAEEYRRNLDSRDEVSRIAPGVFRESSNAERVFFVEGVDGQEDVVRNVFIASNQRGRSGVTVSREGFIETRAERRPLRRPAERAAVRRHSGHRRVPGDRVRALCRADQGARGEGGGAAAVDRLDARAARIDRPRAPGGAAVADRAAARRAEPRAAGDSARVREPARKPVGEPAFSRCSHTRSTATCSASCKAWVAQGRVQFEFGWWVLHAAMLCLVAFLFLWRSTLGFKLWLRR